MIQPAQTIVKLEMPEHVVKNILIFLDRSNLSGSEAGALMEAKHYLTTPTQEKIEEKPVEEK